MSKAKKLIEEHPFMQKVRQVEQLCDTLGVSIIVRYDGTLNIQDTQNNVEYNYRDIEGPIYSENCPYFPYMCETKLVLED